MNVKIKIFSAILCIFILASCSKKPVEFFTIGTYNAEWLGDGINDRKDRTDADYERIAKMLKDMDADVFCLQEIENSGALEQLIKRMPGYSYTIIDNSRFHSQQNTAAIYKKDLEVKTIGEYTPLAVEIGRNRPGLLLNVKKGSVDMLVQVVHLKSSSHFDSTKEMQEKAREIRSRQAEILAHWADSTISAGKDKNLIILGDFNDSPLKKKYPCLEALYSDANMKFITDSLKSVKFKNAYSIDHIVVSKSLYERYVQQSLFIYETPAAFNKEELKGISDHCPIVAKFKIN